MTDVNETVTAEATEVRKDFEILYEDNHIIVVEKKQMTACCPDESKDDNLLDQIKRYIKEKYNKPGNVYVGLVHRLDRPTGGVMVYAKTSKAAARLTEGLQTGDFEKKYLAVLCGAPDTLRGTLCHYLRKNTVNNMVYICTPSEEGAKYAELDYRVIEDKGKYSLVEVRLHTGRTHQIRVQMAGISHPIYGDMRYGGARGSDLHTQRPDQRPLLSGIFALVPASDHERAFEIYCLSARNGNSVESV